MRVLIEIGEPEEALAMSSVPGGDTQKTPEYIDALIKTRNFRLLPKLAYGSTADTKDPTIHGNILIPCPGMMLQHRWVHMPHTCRKIRMRRSCLIISCS